MAKIASTLVVLIDADDIKHVFATWPDHICLAACLTQDGDCSMVVFQRDERATIPQRLLQILQIGVDEVCFVPKVRGLATKHFRYSDERRLMALVASDRDLLDDAIDYAVNYTYALEEGLDPAIVLGRQPVELVAPPRPIAPEIASRDRAGEEPLASREVRPLLPDFLRKSAEKARRPRFATVRKNKIGILVPQT